MNPRMAGVQGAVSFFGNVKLGNSLENRVN